jgi:pimeloyl-ACP methyl ester carboxylesterase
MIWGEADPLFAPSCLEGLGNVALDCRRIPIPQGGHSVFREDLVRATGLVRAFLAQGRST